MTPTGPDALMMRYLLGELTADEEAALDERAFVDDALDEERATAADELIDVYLAGGLTADQRERFETRFLASAEHRERFRLLRDLRLVVERTDDAAPRARASRARIAWAVAAAIALALAALLLLRGRPSPGEREVAEEPTPLPSVTPTPPLPPPTPAPPGAGMATVSVPAEPRTVRVAVDGRVRRVRFRIPVASGGPDRFVARIRRGARTLWEEGDLDAPAAGEPLVVDVPEEVLREDGLALALAPDVTRGASPAPAGGRFWPLRIERR